VDRVGAAQRFGAGFGQADVAHLALAHQLRHGAHRVLDRRLGIDPVLVVQVDRLDAEPLQRRLAGLANIVRPAAESHVVAVGLAHDAELRRHDDALSTPGDRPADEFLVGADAIDVGGVEQRDAAVERPVDGGDRLVFVAPAVEFRHAHAAETDGGRFELAEPTLLHVLYPPSVNTPT
jgi:hypothetical protein